MCLLKDFNLVFFAKCINQLHVSFVSGIIYAHKTQTVARKFQKPLSFLTQTMRTKRTSTIREATNLSNFDEFSFFRLFPRSLYLRTKLNCDLFPPHNYVHSLKHIIYICSPLLCVSHRLYKPSSHSPTHKHSHTLSLPSSNS